MSTFASNSVAATESIAAEWAGSFKGGEVIALEGDLGAGKTQFVRGLLKGLNGDGRTVSSPTYVLMNVYDTGRLKMYHLDAYRVNGPQDFEGIGFDELLEQCDAIVVVEWASRISELLPMKRLDVTIERTGTAHRRITISST